MGQTPPPRGRFAPSPSGRMHLGNLWSALLAWLSARSAGGEMVLRLEDLDTARCKGEYSQQIIQDFLWLGLDWTGEPVYQSRRQGAYDHAFAQLEGQGLLYPCYCNRAERNAASAPHLSDGTVRYDGRCAHLSQAQRRKLEQTRTPAWRVRLPEAELGLVDMGMGDYSQNLARDCGDFILRRADGVYAYQLAVVVDDAFMGVTQVVRGRDLLSSTPRQLWLQGQLGYPHPSYGHLPLILSGEGRRLAKRDRAQELGQLQQRYTAPQLVGRLAHAAGLIPEYAPITPEQLIPLFAWNKLPREDIVLGLE